MIIPIQVQSMVEIAYLDDKQLAQVARANFGSMIYNNGDAKLVQQIQKSYEVIEEEPLDAFSMKMQLTMMDPEP